MNVLRTFADAYNTREKFRTTALVSVEYIEPLEFSVRVSFQILYAKNDSLRITWEKTAHDGTVEHFGLLSEKGKVRRWNPEQSLHNETKETLAASIVSASALSHCSFIEIVGLLIPGLFDKELFDLSTWQIGADSKTKEQNCFSVIIESNERKKTIWVSKDTFSILLITQEVLVSEAEQRKRLPQQLHAYIPATLRVSIRETFEPLCANNL